MRPGAEQHRLLAQLQPFLAPRQHGVGDKGGLVGLVLHGNEARARGGVTLGPQVLGEALGSERDHRVRRRENGPRGAVVLLQRHHGRRRREGSGEIEDVAHRGAAEGVDRLRIVAYHGEAATVGLQRQQDRSLQVVGVLVLVDQHVVEQATDLGAERGLGDHLRPVQQQVVVIEHLLRLLGLDVGAEKPLQLLFPVRAPRKARLQHLGQRRAGIHGGGIDRQAGALLRKAPARARQAELVAHQVQQVRRILAVVDGETRIEADAPGVLTQQPRADAVEGAGPRQLRARQRRTSRRGLGEDAAHTASHFLRGAAREGEQQDAPGVGAVADQARDAVRQGVGLARARAGDHQQRTGRPAACTVHDGLALGRVQAGWSAGGGGRREGSGGERGLRLGHARHHNPVCHAPAPVAWLPRALLCQKA